MGSACADRPTSSRRAGSATAARRPQGAPPSPAGGELITLRSQPRDLGLATAPVSAVADSILYEGYLLYPYRRSSAKNKVRWQFGVLLPRGWAEAHGLTDPGVSGAAESWWQQTECLLSPDPGAEVALRLRFLQLQRRSVQRATAGGFEPVDRLLVGDREETSFDEAVPREADVTARLADLVGDELVSEIVHAGGEESEAVVAASGEQVARVLRTREPVSLRVRLSAAACETAHPLFRLRVRTENTGAAPRAASRDEALGRAAIATHTLIVADGEFRSLLEPPDWAAAEARACRNTHTFPVLAGSPGAGVVLSSPIILYDHPKVAPESAGDLHDAAEIDEILSLRTLTLTDEEKAEARATDRRAADIVDRVDNLPPDAFNRLHGAIRGLTRSPLPDEPDGVIVDGVRVRSGSRVLLRPRRHGTDPQDMFLTGRTARVTAVLTDVDDERHVVVTLDDDPATELNEWYGRYRYFHPDEVAPLEEAP